MELVEARAGFARVSVPVAERFLNALGTGHGALLFAVADVAFALAVNGAVDAVGVQFSMNTFRPAKAGEVVTAEANVIHGGRRSLVCEISLTGGDGRLLARALATALPVGQG